MLCRVVSFQNGQGDGCRSMIENHLFRPLPSLRDMKRPFCGRFGAELDESGYIPGDMGIPRQMRFLIF